MTPNTECTPTEAPAHLVPIALDLMRAVRRLRAEALAYRELLILSIEQVREQDREIDRLRHRHQQLVDEHRTLRQQFAACRRRAA